MSEIYAHRAYKVTLYDKFTVEWKFIRNKSGAFQYGNQTTVLIICGDHEHALIDTRYDTSVMKDFSQWCENWLKSHFRAETNAKWEDTTIS